MENKVDSYEVVKMAVGIVAGIATATAVGCVVGPSIAAEEGGKKIIAGAGAILLGMYTSRQVKQMVRNDMDAYKIIGQRMYDQATKNNQTNGNTQQSVQEQQMISRIIAERRMS